MKYVIVNVNSGPGTSIDSDYAKAIKNLQDKGIVTVGYVDSNYAAVNMAEVKHNIDLWRSLYSVSSHFIDQTSSKSSDLAYYTEIYNYVKANSTNNIIVINPGTEPFEGI